jgi:hypothetical protein
MSWVSSTVGSVPDRSAPGPGVVGGQRAVAAFLADGGAGEAPLVGWRSDHGQVAQAFGQATGAGVGADQLQLDVRVAGGPAALELQGVPAQRRPGMADAQPPMAGRRLADKVVGVGQQLPGLGQDLDAGRGRGDAAAGPVQQPDPQHLLEREEGAGDGGLGDAQLDGGVGEAAGVDDRDQAAQLPQLEIHNRSVSQAPSMHFAHAAAGPILAR